MTGTCRRRSTPAAAERVRVGGSPSVTPVDRLPLAPRRPIRLSEGTQQTDLGELATDARVELERPADHAPPVRAGLVIGVEPAGELPHQPVEAADRRVQRRVLAVECRRRLGQSRTPPLLAWKGTGTGGVDRGHRCPAPTPVPAIRAGLDAESANRHPRARDMTSLASHIDGTGVSMSTQAGSCRIS